MDVPEESVLEMLLNWLGHQRSSRMAHAHKLLKKINFVEIHPAHLTSLVRRKFASNLPRYVLFRAAIYFPLFSIGILHF